MVTDYLAFLAIVIVAIFCSLTLVWLSLYGVAVDRAADFLRRPRIRRAIDAITGLALTPFGIKLATERT